MGPHISSLIINSEISTKNVILKVNENKIEDLTKLEREFSYNHLLNCRGEQSLTLSEQLTL